MPTAPGVFRRRQHPLPKRRSRRRIAGTNAPLPLTAGTASFVSSGPSTIVVTSTDASGGTPSYTYQWQRNVNGGSYSNISNGGGVSGATTKTLTDGSVSGTNLYGYKLVFTDSASGTATSNSVTAQRYTGGAIAGGGGTVIGSPIIRGSL